MKQRWWLAVIIPLLILTVGLLVRANLPAVLQVSPADGATITRANTPFSITFSRAMQPQSVYERIKIQPPIAGRYTWEGTTFTFTPEQAWPSGKTITLTLQTGARTTLGLPLLGEQSWSFSVSPPWLIYLWPATGPADLYAIDLTANQITRLTQTANGILSYHAAPQSRQIYFSTRLDAQNSAIYRWQPGQTAPQEILRCTQALCDSPQISPDGRSLAYTRAPLNPVGEPFAQQIWILPLPEGEPAPEGLATLVSDSAHPSGNPAWSPAGVLSFYDSQTQEFIALNLQTGQKTTFPSETGEPGSWSPDGNRFILHEITFWGAGPLDFSSHIVQFQYPSAQRRQLSSERSLQDLGPVYAPQGWQIAFARKSLDPESWTLGSQLWLINFDGSDPRPLTNQPNYNHSSFAWHPNGQTIAFVRHNQATLTDPPELWIINADGSNPLRLVIDAYAPQWMP